MAIEKKVLSLQPENRNRKKRKSYTMKTKKHITTILLAAMLWAGGAMAQTTECAVLPLPFIPNFNTLDYFVSDTVPGDSLPPCWHNTYIGTDVSSSHVLRYRNNRTMLSLNFPQGNILSTPLLAVMRNPLHISFNYATNYGVPYMLEVGYMTDASDPTTFVLLESLRIPTNTNLIHPLEFYTDSIPADTVCIAFRRAATNSGMVYITDVAVFADSGCRRPSAVYADNVTDASAYLHWTPQATVSAGYQVCYSPSNSHVDPSAVSLMVADTSALVTSLNPNSTYYVWVRPMCDTNHPFSWDATTSFTTQLHCYPITRLSVPQVGATSVGVRWQFDESHYRQASDMVLAWRDTVSGPVWDTLVVPAYWHETWIPSLLPSHTYIIEARTLCNIDTASALTKMVTTDTVVRRPLLMASPVDSTTIRLTWSDMPVHTIEFRAAADSLWIPLYAMGDSMHVTLLEPATNYLFRAVAGTGTAVRYSDVVSASTLCGYLHVPYHQVYDSNSLACWNVAVASNAVPRNTWNGTPLLLGTSSVVILAPVTEDVRQLQLRLAYTKYTGNLHWFEVGVSDSPEDTSAIEWLHTVALNGRSSITQGDTTLTFANYSGYGRHFALRCTGTGDRFGFDTMDITVADCLPVEQLYFDSLEPDAVRLVWNTCSTAAAYLVKYGIDGGTDTTIMTYDTALTLHSLLPTTDYHARLFAICHTGDTMTGSRTLLFHTPCPEYVPIPLFEDFSCSGLLPECWTAVAQTEAYPATQPMYPKIQSGRLYFGSKNGDTCIAATPLIPAYGNRLHVSYRLTMSRNSSLHFSAGLMSSLSDTSTFIPLVPPRTSSYDNEFFEFSTDTVPQCLPNVQYYVAFRFICNQVGRMTASIDEVSVTSLDSCRRPENATVTNVGIHTISLSWDSTGADAYLLTCQGGDSVMQYVTNQPHATLDSLMGNTSYTLSVSSICGSDTSFPFNVGNVLTRCDVYPLPYYNDFNSSTPGYPSMCWASNGNELSIMRVVIDHAFSGYSLAVGSSFAASPMIVVPEGGLHVSFLASCAYPTHYSDFTGYVGTYMWAGTLRVVNGEIVLADSLVHTYIGAEHLTTTAWNSYSFYADSSMAGDTIVVLLRGAFPSVYFDNFLVEAAGCRPPIGIAPVYTGHDSIALSWSSVQPHTTSLLFSCSINNNPDDSTAILVSVPASDTVVSFGHLLPDTLYHFWVKALCDSLTPDISSWQPLQPVRTEGLPQCPPPFGLEVIAFDTVTATVGWLPDDSTALWQLRLSDPWGDTSYHTSLQSTYFFDQLLPATTYTLAVRRQCSGTLFSMWSDSIVFATDTLTPVCPTPEGLTVRTFDSISATLEWQSTDEANQWQLHLISSQQDTLLQVSIPRIMLSSLRPATLYKASVRAQCSDTLFSRWSDTVLFFTDSTANIGVPAVSGGTGGMVLAPNPARKQVVVTLPLDGCLLTVTDMWGREVWKATVSRRTTIDLSQWTRGIYLVRYTSGHSHFAARLTVE